MAAGRGGGGVCTQPAYAARLRQYDETIARPKTALESKLADQKVRAERTRALLDREPVLEQLSEQNFGSRARIKLDAYPFQKFGVLEGRLQTVSCDIFVSDATLPGSGRAVDRARVALTSTTPGRLKEPLRLLPGMTMTADVIVGQRTVLSCFPYPLTRAVDESIRER